MATSINQTPIFTHIDRASFSIWSKDEIKQLSVKKITEPKSFEKLGAINEDGLYSRALGPTQKFDTCTTCGRGDFSGCPGHYGHIELPVPVYHPMLVQHIFQILNRSCLHCFHLRVRPMDLSRFKAKIEALNCGFDHLIDELDAMAEEQCRDDKARDDPYTHIMLNKLLFARIEEEKEKTQDFDCHNRPQQRSIVERMSKLYREFFNGKDYKPDMVCKNCNEKKLVSALINQSVISVNVNKMHRKVLASKEGKRKVRVAETEAIAELEKTPSDLKILRSSDQKFLTPLGMRYCFRELWKNERETLQSLFSFLNIENSMSGVKQEAKIEKSDPDFSPVDLFFIDTMLVPPGKFRPPMSQRGYAYEGPRTAALAAVMKQAVIVQDAMDTLRKAEDEIDITKAQAKLQSTWKELQIAVNSVYDIEMIRYNRPKFPGLKQLIDKKEGLFRKHMMGKRVNFAARSVISPDPNISVDQIGVPLVFAMKLTYPSPVTAHNIEQLRQAVLNGPDKYPGAHSVLFDNGRQISLIKESVRQQIAAKLSCKPRYGNHPDEQDTHQATIVNRHLLSGDVLLFNRQPTLHKPSIMAFRARVLPHEKGFRLHYANCKSFNADFDGDEMNAHLPQGELARSEAYNIASVNYQYLVPKDGSPLGGLIQDHVVGVCIMTQRDQFFNKERYNQLVYCALESLGRPLRLEPPAIMRPEPLWTGKQVVTTIIKNCIPQDKPALTLDIKSKIGAKILGIPPEYESLSDCHVIIRNGELHTGFMDKSNVGATQYGLVHACYELYGGETSSAIMSAFARLATWYLQLYEGFTLGIIDILVNDDANEDRRRSIEASKLVGPVSAKEALGIDGDVEPQVLVQKLREAHTDRDPLPMKKLDASMKSRTDKYASEISGRCLPGGLTSPFPANNLQMMIQSGAKGGTVNAIQISCLLGQIELEGRRVPLSMSGRSLPSFRPYDTCPKAGGFVSGRFLTGIQPQEFFFHCMAGREGLIDTAVKTSRSGYLQRCLIKHLEGVTVHYDQTVRDSCGSVIQFLYGEDGLDITKCQLLKEKAFKLLVNNYKIISPQEDEMMRLNKSKESYEDEVIARLNDIQAWLDQNGDDRIRQIRGSGFLDFLAHKKCSDDTHVASSTTTTKRETTTTTTYVKTEKIEELDENDMPIEPPLATATQVMRAEVVRYEKIFEAWYALSFKEKKKWNRLWQNCPDPLISVMNPAAHFGVVPENLDEQIKSFVAKNPRLISDSAALVADESAGAAAAAINASINACDENPELSKSILSHWQQQQDGAQAASSSKRGPKLTKHEFFDLCYNLYMKMLAQPGEAVGLLAAQSIGEPSTQMTLNTFHFAGRGEMNVTLGIPRLREILMTASAKIGTPSMDLPLLDKMYDSDGNELTEEQIEEQAMRVKLALNAVRLSDVLEYVDITEQVVDRNVDAEHDALLASAGKPRKRARKDSSVDEAAAEAKSGGGRKGVRYDITFVALPSKYYKHEFKTKSTKVMQFIENTFVRHLIDSMLKRQKRLQDGESLYDQMTKRGKERAAASKASAAGAPGDAGNDAEELDLDEFNAKEMDKENVKEDESSSDDDDDGEGDNTAAKLKSRRQDLDYEEPDDDDLEVGDVEATAAQDDERENADEISDESAAAAAAAAADAATDELSPPPSNKRKSPDDDDTQQQAAGDAGDLEHHKVPKSRRSSSAATPLDEASVRERIRKVVQLPHVVDYEYDTNHDRWCKLSLCIPLTTSRLDLGALIESEARRTYVHQVGNIQRALLVKDVNAKSRGAKCDKMVKTEGVSLLLLVKFNHILNLNAIYSNDIHAIARTYGIEAAAQAIRREMANVFAVYGIEVDSRHLSLIADCMTYSGHIRGMNRMSMEASASPFQQMSFESTIRYLKSSTISGFYDDIKSPSASLVFGRPTRGGTGLFSLLADEQQIERQQQQQQKGIYTHRQAKHYQPIKRQQHQMKSAESVDNKDAAETLADTTYLSDFELQFEP